MPAKAQEQHPKQKPASGHLFLSKLAALPDENVAEAAGQPAKRLQPGQQQGPIEPIAGAEEVLWKEFSASFRRRNNKIG